MIFPDVFRLVFIICCALLTVILAFLSVWMFKKKNEYRIAILKPISAGILSIIAYSLFLLSENHELAVFFDSLFFIGTDWLALFMLEFSISYTGYCKKQEKQLGILFSAFAALDTLDLFINNFTHHMFNLGMMHSFYADWYWGNEFYFFHYLHLGFCYVMVGMTFVIFALSVIKSSKFYKKKYSSIFLMYVLVIAVNMACYSINLPFDVSVILYGLLAGFICYFSTYSYPHSLVNLSLLNVNDTVSDGILYFDMDCECIYANKAAREIFSDFGVYNQKMAEDYRLTIEKDWDSKGLENKIETFMRGTQPRRYKVDFKKEYYRGQEIGSYVQLIDYTAAINSIEREHYAAIHDELTGLFNRVGYFEVIDEYVHKNGTAGKLMLSSNIRDFKLINDLFGEKAGDEVLVREGQILVEAAHYNSLCGRTGDDKFSVFIDKDFFTEEIFSKYIKNLQKITEASMYQMHVSVGIYDPHGRIESAQVMYDKTLMAMESSKDNYSKVYSYYDSALMDKLLNEKNIADDFAFAIDKGQIQMYLQPIVSDDSEKTGAEALCRWNHPLRGFMKPVSFLNILEKRDLIYRLDEYMWTQAAKKVREWNEKGLKHCYISVNVSVKDFFYTDIYKTFMRLIETYDIEPSALHIEITEAVLMSDFAKAFMLSDKLQKQGFLVAIDNFGTGYSSLNMLKDLKAQIIKMNMSFLQQSSKQERGEIILKTIFDMADSLRMEVIGEGVENKEQYDILSSMGCKNFQGNYIDEPMSVVDFENKYIKAKTALS